MREKQQMNKYAVLVGIGSSGDTRMNMDGDGRLMASILKDAGYEVHSFINKKATRNKVLSELEWLANQSGDIVFFSSSHGSMSSIFMWDATINGEELQSVLSSASAKQLIIIHCCFAHNMMDYIQADNRISITAMTADYTPKLTAFGYFFLDQALKIGMSVQEANEFARGAFRGNNQMVDNYGSPFYL